MINWIKFSKDRPEEGQEVLILCDDGIVFKTVFRVKDSVPRDVRYKHFTHWTPYNPPPAEPKMKKVAPAIYKCLNYWYLADGLYESMEEARLRINYHTIIWPAPLPDKDGFYQVPEEE